MSGPTLEQASALHSAVLPNFGPCTCTHGARGICPGHAFLLADPTQRQRAKVWQRLLWMRSQRAVLEAEEGTGLAALITSDPNVLPW